MRKFLLGKAKAQPKVEVAATFAPTTLPSDLAINRPDLRAPLVTPLSLVAAGSGGGPGDGINPIVITEPSLVQLLEFPALPANELDTIAEYSWRPAGSRGRTNLVTQPEDEFENPFEGPYAYFEHPGEYEILLEVPSLAVTTIGMRARLIRKVSVARYLAMQGAPTHRTFNFFRTVTPGTRLDLAVNRYTEFPSFRKILIANVNGNPGFIYLGTTFFRIPLNGVRELNSPLLGRVSVMGISSGGIGNTTFQGVISLW